MRPQALLLGGGLIAIAAALAAYLFGVWRQDWDAAQVERTWVEDHAAMVELGSRVSLPEAYQAVECDVPDDSVCWRTERALPVVADDVKAALVEAGLSDVSSTCHELEGLGTATCEFTAPFGHDREVWVWTQVDMDVDALPDDLSEQNRAQAYADALTGTSTVWLSIPALCPDAGEC